MTQQQPQPLSTITPEMMHHITTPRRTALVGKIINGQMVTMGLHHFCEYCTKYMLGNDETCPHCGREVI